MNSKGICTSMIAVLWFTLASSGSAAEAIYKWTDANGRVHYGQKKPENVRSVEMVDITPTPAATSNTNPLLSENSAATEVDRINALSERLASERRAAEQARQEQAIRNLEQANQQLQNSLLNQQLEQQRQQTESDDSIILYPNPYAYPPHSYPPYPPKPYPLRPCQPWPECHRPSPLPRPPEPSPPLAKPNPPFKPKPIGLDNGASSPGVFRGR